jgi:hypothetical protein
MKGFIRILESIIACVIILVSITFFFNLNIKQTDWDNTLIKIRSEDVMAALAKNGTIAKAVSTNDANLINNAVQDSTLGLLPATAEYLMEIRGIPNPFIYISCNCTDAEIANLQTRLSPLDFKYKDRSISIRIAQDSLENIRKETNIMFLFGYRDLNQYRANLEGFLEKGGTIFMLGDLNQAQVQDGFLNDVFALSWASGTRTNTGRFFEPDNENITSFRIMKYYNNLTEPDMQDPAFTFSGTDAKIAYDNRTIIKTDIHSLVKVNMDIVRGNGRTVWMSDYTSSPETNALMKSVVLWASGERFVISPEKSVPAKHFRTSYIIRDKDVYEAILIVWRIFQ